MAENDQMKAALFMQLVLTFQTAAWQQMGKIKNPLTDKIERDLNQARFSIDMLDMIRTKTEGNLTENEKQFINRAISELQLNYIADVGREQKEKEKEKEKEAKEKKPESPKKSPKTRTKKGKKKQSKER